MRTDGRDASRVADDTSQHKSWSYIACARIGVFLLAYWWNESCITSHSGCCGARMGKWRFEMRDRETTGSLSRKVLKIARPVVAPISRIELWERGNGKDAVEAKCAIEKGSGWHHNIYMTNRFRCIIIDVRRGCFRLTQIAVRIILIRLAILRRQYYGIPPRQ